MKNPSQAGNHNDNNSLISDDTIYRALNYLFKSKLFSKVIILNMFAKYEGTFTKLELDPEEIIIQNNKVILEYCNNLDATDRIFAAWGSYSENSRHKANNPNIISEEQYYQRIIEVTCLLVDKPTFIVGKELSSGDPPHGKWWYDFESIKRFNLINYRDIILNNYNNYF